MVKRILTTLAVAAALAAPAADFAAAEPEFLKLSLGQVLFAPQGARDPARPFVRLAVNIFATPNRDTPIIFATIKRLAAVFGPGNFEAHVLRNVESVGAECELVLGSAGTYLRSRTTGSRDIATLVSNLSPDPNHGEGSLFVTLKSSPIRSFEDMRGKIAAVLGPKAFTGNSTAMGEVARRGYDPDTFFSSMVSTLDSMPRELDLLRNGAADVAVVRACFIEEMKRVGADVSDIRPLAVRSQSSLKCLASTDLYPNWTMFVTPRATPEVARTATAVLLTMAPDAEGRAWAVATDFTPVDELYRTLRRGPYETLRTLDWRRLWREYQHWVWMALLALLGLIAHAVRSEVLVRRRTAELESSMQRQIQAERRAGEASSRLEKLQKLGAIGQMSSIIAHELRQPLSAITGYAAGLLRILDRPGTPSRDLLEQGIERMRSEAQLCDRIVQKVRGYAKRPASSRVPLDLKALAGAAVDTVLASRPAKCRIARHLAGSPVRIQADPLEMELMAANLVKNAIEAASSCQDALVSVAVREEGGRALLVIDNSASDTSDEALARLTEPLTSSKIEGLGLGISIVRMIVESHQGHIAYSRSSPDTLRCSLDLPLLKDSSDE